MTRVRLQFSHGRARFGHMVSGKVSDEWLADFEAAARRTLKERMDYAFIHTYKPVFDDEPFRSFGSMEDYRRWCEENLPSWLGYGKAI